MTDADVEVEEVPHVAPRRLAVAASNQLAADAGAAMAAVGGNAVDGAIAATLVAMVTEPGIVSLGGGCYLTVVTPETAEVVDANVTMPGKGLSPDRFGRGCFDIATEYGGGIDITIGHGSVAVPGSPYGLHDAHRRHGAAPWKEVVAPAIAAARDGFPLGPASDYYLEYVHQDLYGWHAPSHAALHHPDGRRLVRDEVVRLPDLADVLEQFATHGVEVFRDGDVGRAIVADVQANEGILTREDLRTYEPLVRSPATARTGDWQWWTNPPPAIGGAIVVALLVGMEGRPHGGWTSDDVARLVAVQEAVLGHRVTTLDVADDRYDATTRMLETVRERGVSGLSSPSTANISVVDDAGTACTITSSSGYGSGVMPPGTGLWLNNCLGEQELNRRGLHAWPVGVRLPSNMAPTVGRRDDGRLLAIGSPGADRITTAIAQTILTYVGTDLDLEGAVRHPRLHVRHFPDEGRLVVGHEADLDLPPLPHPTREHHELAMFFGGVTAALRHTDGTLETAADPRRGGGTAIA